MEWLKGLNNFCLVLAHGDPPSVALGTSFRSRAKLFIALDGAAHWAIKNHLNPDLIIGDLDSVDAQIIGSYNHHKIEDQNSNDLEKSFIYCLQEGFEQILVLGAFGKRADHFLTNVYVLRKYAARAEIIFADDHQIAFMCSPKKPLVITGMNNCYLSLFPLSAQVGPITTSGLAYTLKHEW